MTVTKRNLKLNNVIIKVLLFESKLLKYSSLVHDLSIPRTGLPFFFPHMCKMFQNIQKNNTNDFRRLFSERIIFL